MTTPPIGYVVTMFPRLSETFIRNEILELESRLLVDGGLRRRLAVQAGKTIEERFELSTNFARLRNLLQETAMPQVEAEEPLAVMATQSNAHRLYHG